MVGRFQKGRSLWSSEGGGACWVQKEEEPVRSERGGVCEV